MTSLEHVEHVDPPSVAVVHKIHSFEFHVMRPKSKLR
jgi:hypothetical protein